MRVWIRANVVAAALLAALLVTVDAQADSIWAVSYNRAAPQSTSDQLLRFDSGSPNNVTVVGNTGLANNLMFRGLDFDRAGNLYAYATNETTFTAAGLYRLNTTTGLATFIGSGGVVTDGFVWDLSYDPATDTMYGIGNSGFAQHTRTQLYTIDLSTGAATKVGNVSSPGGGLFHPAGLATDASGTRYILDVSGSEVVKLQGLSTVALPNPLGFAAFGIYGMTIDWSGDGTWYIAGQLNYFAPPPGIRSRSEFRTVDPATGITTLVGTIGPTGGEFGGPGDIAIMPFSRTVPEPPSVALMALGVLALLVLTTGRRGAGSRAILER